MRQNFITMLETNVGKIEVEFSQNDFRAGECNQQKYWQTVGDQVFCPTDGSESPAEFKISV